MGNKVFCSWVNAEVDQDDLNEHCDEKIKDGKCNECELCEMIKNGASVKIVLKNITRSE
jgi:hypothetical protein